MVFVGFGGNVGCVYCVGRVLWCVVVVLLVGWGLLVLVLWCFGGGGVGVVWFGYVCIGGGCLGYVGLGCCDVG